MKYLWLLISSVFVFFIMLANLYTNTITLDIKKIQDYVAEESIIFEELLEKEESVVRKKDDYLSRLVKVKNGFQNSKTTILIKEYKKYKILSINSLIKSISQEDSRASHLERVYKYNKLSYIELEKLLNKSLIGSNAISQ